jgi:hypothetical protein
MVSEVIGDLLGNATCINERGCSVVDYAVASESLLSSVNYYIFKNPSYFSDHNQIATHLKCYGKVMNTNDSQCKKIVNLSKKVSFFFFSKNFFFSYIYLTV